MGGQCNAMAALRPGEKPGTPCIGGWVDPRASMDGCRKSRSPLGFDPWTAQPVENRYTDHYPGQLRGGTCSMQLISLLLTALQLHKMAQSVLQAAFLNDVT